MRLKLDHVFARPRWLVLVAPMALLACGTSTTVAPNSGPPSAAVASEEGGTTSSEADGGGSPASVLPLELATGLRVACLAAGADAVYACVSGELRKIPIDGSAPSVLWKAPSGELLHQLALDGDRLFATTDSRLHVVGVDGSGSKDLHTGSRLHRALAWSSGYVFALDGNAIVSVAGAGGAPKKGNYDFPTSLVGGGAYVWLVEGDSSSDGFDVTVLKASTMKSTLRFSIGNQGASGAKVRHDRFASDGDRVYTGAAKSVSNRVEIEEYDNPPSATANNGIERRHLGDLDAYAVHDLAADAKGLVVATNEAIYSYDRAGAKFVSLAKGGPGEHIALTSSYVFWVDGETLRATPR